MAHDVAKARSFLCEKYITRFLGDVNVITGELQHNLVVVDVDKKQKKTEWKVKNEM